MGKYNESNSKGITLVALVIIVIILIILSGISIYAVVGENGIIAKAKLSKEENRASIVQDEVDIWNAEKENSIDSGNPARTREDVLNKLVTDGNLTPEEKVIIEETGSIKIASRTIEFIENTVSKKERTFKILAQGFNSTGDLLMDELPGTILEIYKDKECTDLLKTINMIDSGIYKWEGEILPKGSYYIKTPTAPNGYNPINGKEFVISDIYNEEWILEFVSGNILSGVTANYSFSYNSLVTNKDNLNIHVNLDETQVNIAYGHKVYLYYIADFDIDTETTILTNDFIEEFSNYNFDYYDENRLLYTTGPKLFSYIKENGISPVAEGTFDNTGKLDFIRTSSRIIYTRRRSDY
ncbi:MAG: hypothetical protein HFJ45_05685 [Clostridia bacterium]|nr:hypothetical protein [Clostridia bacterium]